MFRKKQKEINSNILYYPDGNVVPPAPVKDSKPVEDPNGSCVKCGHVVKKNMLKTIIHVTDRYQYGGFWPTSEEVTYCVLCVPKYEMIQWRYGEDKARYYRSRSPWEEINEDGSEIIEEVNKSAL